MSAVASLGNNTSTLAFTVPANAIGFHLWSEVSATLRISVGTRADSTSYPIAGASVTAPKSMVRYFIRNPRPAPTGVHIFQNSGSSITSGVNFDILTE